MSLRSLPLSLWLLFWLLLCTDHRITKAAERIQLVRGPYLQSVTSESIAVLWDTDQPGSSQVDFGIVSLQEQSIQSQPSSTHHEMVLAGLKENTRYLYQVSTNGQPLGDTHTFKTAVGSSSSFFSFTVLGDTQNNQEVQQQIVDRMTSLVPDFVLHAGDMVDEGLESSQWDTFFRIEMRLLAQIPFFGALGNHERASPLYFGAFRLPGNERWYSLEYGNLHLVVLEADGTVDYGMGSEQGEWLQRDLSLTRQRWKLVLLHYPLYSSGYNGSTDSSVRQALEPLFLRYGVDLVFSGHDHHYERNLVQGITYIVSGGGGAPLYPLWRKLPTSVFAAVKHHFVRVRVTPVALFVEAIQPDGERLDSFILSKPWKTYLPSTSSP